MQKSLETTAGLGHGLVYMEQLQMSLTRFVVVFCLCVGSGIENFSWKMCSYENPNESNLADMIGWQLRHPLIRSSSLSRKEPPRFVSSAT